MSVPDEEEAMHIISRIGPVVMSAAVDMTSDSGTALRRMVGMMVVDYNMLHRATFGTVFAMILDLTRQCAATLVTTDRIRKAALAETPAGLPATQTVLAIVRLTLASEAQVLAGMAFRSRDEVDAIATAMNDAFSATEERASDDLDAHTYIALMSLHGDVTKHLADQGRVLPRVISYQYQMVMPSLRMAQYVYADPSRSDELIAENNVVHPAFMPRTGKMLAV
jgi:prophage DNA circulation protein